MIRSLLTGVSGVLAHQKKLDVVGNNIANVNTAGFKKSTVAFQDLLSQMDRGAMAPDGNRGGVNPRQVGMGVKVGAIQTIHTQGPMTFTGSRTDMAIQGEGYFVVNAGNEQYYTRAGNFVLDGNSDLVTSGNGYKVQGYERVVGEDGKEIWGSNPVDINIPMGQKLEAKATTLVGYRCNLDSRVPSTTPGEEADPASVHRTSSVIYDSLGGAHNMITVWTKTDDNTWQWDISIEGEDPEAETPEIAVTGGSGTVTFGPDGKLVLEESPVITVGFSAIGLEDTEIELDFTGKAFDKETIDGVTQYGSAFTTKPYTQDGYTMGVMNDFYVTEDGILVGSYDNGHVDSLFKVSMAMFSNPQGLTKVGDTCFARSINSGEPNIVSATVEGAGTIAGSTIEASNVDITEEFTQMILAQRGYQSNARVITTSDSVLEEAINLKR
ncbi:MAG: flagellar hook protein FlgE [Synergistales bacterium]|nr:flagellar hook protein FlgE [Synergistales bacterium]